MNRSLLKASLALIFVFSFSCLFSKPTAYFLSPLGNDNNTGTKLSPFLTLDRAFKAIQETRGEDCVLWLADGNYEITKAITFTSDEFSSRTNSIKIQALPGTHPVISGGKLIEGWKPGESGLWEADLQMDQAPREIYIEGQRGTRARFPNTGYLRVKKVGEDRRTNFVFRNNEFPVPRNTKDVELILLHDWSISRIAVDEIDFEQKKLRAVDSIGAKNPGFFNLDNWEKNPRYFLENDLAFLDADYEWYYDSGRGKIYLKLPADKHPGKLKITVPVSEGMVIIEGQEENRVKNIHFKGLSFQHCAWSIPEMGYCGVQACHYDSRPKAQGWSVVPAAVKVDWAENISFTDCTFKNLGTSGLWLSTGSRNCSVANSVFTGISGNGIMIGEGRDRVVDGKAWWKEAAEQAAMGNRIEKCTVTACGTQFFGAVGIWCGLTAETTIEACHIFDLPYSGISIGWMWSPEATPCRDNIIDGNHIHHILNALSDGGGIYILGLQPGSKLINNKIHDVKVNAGRAESNGMFLDEGTTDVLVANNLIYNIAKSPLRFHRASINLVKDNYLFCTNDNPPIRYNTTKEEDIKKVGNRIFSEGNKDYLQELEKALDWWDERK